MSLQELTFYKNVEEIMGKKSDKGSEYLLKFRQRLVKCNICLFFSQTFFIGLQFISSIRRRSFYNTPIDFIFTVDGKIFHCPSLLFIYPKVNNNSSHFQWKKTRAVSTALSTVLNRRKNLTRKLPRHLWRLS